MIMFQGGFVVKRAKWMAIGVVALSGALAGCGIQSAQASQYLHVVPGTNVINLTVKTGYSNDLAENTVDGVPAGDLTINVPVGSEVHMKFINDGPLPESMGIYQDITNLAFPGSGDSYENASLGEYPGLIPGQSQSYTFTASRVGTYTLSDLVDGVTSDNIPVSNIWETFKVVSSGAPSLTTKS